MATCPVHSDSDWKNPRFLTSWKATRRKTLEQRWEDNYKPLFDGAALAARRDPTLAGVLAFARGTLLAEGESLCDRARRLEQEESRRGNNRSRRSTYAVQNAIGKDDAGDFVIADWARAATPNSQECSKFLYEIGLTKKAQRRIACYVLWGKRPCPNGHKWKVAYQCGNRYCQNCGPRRIQKLQAESMAKFAPVVADIRAKNKSAVVASIDFTWRNTGQMPGKKEIRFFNSCIKKCFRLLARRYGFTRNDYGLLFCDEFGGSNTNLHAHGVYVGPWLPQTKAEKQLSKAWAKATGGLASIVSIKLRPNFASGIAHAVKYPAKYVESSTPARLAQLEVAFHGVRQIHTLARFYNVKRQEVEDELDFCSCPICDAPLPEIMEWVPFAEVRHLPDLEAFVRRKHKAIMDQDRPPPAGSSPRPDQAARHLFGASSANTNRSDHRWRCSVLNFAWFKVGPYRPE